MTIKINSVACIIPARYGSTRFEGKPLFDLCGKPMIQRVYEQAKKAKLIDSGVYIATDDIKIRDIAEGFGAEVRMSNQPHRTGTDRIAEAMKWTRGDIIVNVQGDEPLIDPRAIDALIHPFLEHPELVMGTLISKITNPTDIDDKNVVKVIKSIDNFALYFSRLPIPFSRDGDPVTYYKQAGVYIFRRKFLEVFPKLPVTAYEECEKLEQLRALEHGYPIKLVETEYESTSVDTIEDAYTVIKLLQASTVQRR
jgi:3-deoxy-manno-octulosonate cytidylyltransferase (CMP-KDO synthetase)